MPANETWLAKRVLDEGSLGVVFPFTSTRELAERAVASCRYPPLGVRGFGPALALSRYGMGAPEYVRFANENVLVVVIIEQKEAVENIETIASVPGTRVLFVGVNDLSYSLGVGGRTTDPLVEQALVKVLEAGRRHAPPRRLSHREPRRDQPEDRPGLPLLPGLERHRAHGRRRRDLLSKVERNPGAPRP